MAKRSWEKELKGEVAYRRSNPSEWTDRINVECDDVEAALNEIERLRADLEYHLWQRNLGPKPPGNEWQVGKEWGTDRPDKDQVVEESGIIWK
jgi:hypothetical protein